jgi:hypothetical protein
MLSRRVKESGSKSATIPMTIIQIRHFDAAWIS